MKLYDEVINCRLCERLVSWREEVARTKKRAYLNWDYWGKPVPGFGDINGQVLVVGLAPGAHGSNRTGRMFTGDSSGDFLYPALYKAGFASQPKSSDISDGLKLNNLYITAICRCVPPQNKPTPEEIRNCLPFLEQEIAQMKNLKILVALGAIAHHHLQRIYSNWLGMKIKISFSHGNFEKLPGNHPYLLSSYHPSRQNTQTGKLTEIMFDDIWGKVNQLITESF
jgi:uracil-DNA glycosylase family 4